MIEGGSLSHEMAHACGMGHSLAYMMGDGCASANDPACQVQSWFAEEFDDLNPEAPGDCGPSEQGGRWSRSPRDSKSMTVKRNQR